MPKKTETTEAETVTFLAKESPTQCFTFNGVMYNYINGEFATDDADLIAFLDANHASVRK